MNDSKRLETVRARAALQGIELRCTQTDTEQWLFVVTCGAFLDEYRTLEDVECLLDTVESMGGVIELPDLVEGNDLPGGSDA